MGRRGRERGLRVEAEAHTGRERKVEGEAEKSEDAARAAARLLGEELV